MANGVSYGLGSGLWTQNLSRAHRFARDIDAGMVWVNSYKVVHPASRGTVAQHLSKPPQEIQDVRFMKRGNPVLCLQPT